ncbi:MAG: fibronectin type III domain-containing protein [Bacteroidales bacterium]|nr:fibronectin type III domain-containing protein [Bacteroidales bacterium]
MKKVVLGLVLCLSGLAMSLFGIVPPTLQCIHLNHNATDAQIYWNHPSLYSGIQTIEVYVSTTSNGPFVLASTVTAQDTVCSTQFNLTALLGDADNLYCYLKVIPNAAHASEGVAYSDTMQSMRMTLTPTGPNPTQNSIALLQWENPNPFPSTCANQQFSIWRKHNTDIAYTRVGWVDQSVHTFRDTIAECEAIYDYYVSIYNYAQDINPACQMSTRAKRGTFSDGTPPATPTLDSISVDVATQRIVLGWSQNSPDAIGCIIFYSPSNGPDWPAIDTVIGTQWTSPHNATGNHYYRIAAIDRCFDGEQTIAGNMTYPAQNNMVLYCNGMDACRKIIKLKWDVNQYFTSGVAHYEIYYSSDGGNWQYLDQVDGNRNQYDCNGLPTNHVYGFYVRAIGNDANITATTSRCNVTDYNEEESSDICYITHASVIENQYVEVKILTDGANTPFTELHLYKSVNNDQNFNYLATLSYVPGQSYYLYDDEGADIQGSVNYYKASLLNECGHESAGSNIAHTILLSGEANPSQENTIRWNNYGAFSGGTASYSVYRKVEVGTYFDNVENGLPASEYNTYDDNVSSMFEFGSHFQYYVEAHEGPNEYGFSDVSTSNYVEVEQMPNAYIPNAFCPYGTIVENQSFKPVNSFMSTVGYLFTIYSRQGEIVFQTTDITMGWDGTEQKSGKDVPAGMYVYRLQYTTPTGEKIVRNGTVMLLR